MARKKKIGELKDSEIECGYCDAIIPQSAQRCPNCGKYFSSFKKLMAFTIVVVIVLAGMSYFVYSSYISGQEGYIPPLQPIDPDDPNPSSDGKTIQIEMFTTRTPITSKNFIDLANQGKFTNVPFHRVIDNFMIQGGDFTNEDGTGGHAAEYHNGLGNPSDENSWRIPDEFHPELSNLRGTISMANSGPDTGGSQFFINTVANTNLDPKHAVFGEVVSGMDIVDQIGRLDKDASDRPLTPVTFDARIQVSDGITYAILTVDF